uniref:Uncharacterized protein n=1 Tax=Arundo donax TaxID=35708 RepID=A0A0A9BJW0_ARUDO
MCQHHNQYTLYKWIVTCGKRCKHYHCVKLMLLCLMKKLLLEVMWH